MKKITIKKSLDEKAYEIIRQEINRENDCDWTLAQVKQSIKNQDYLKFLVFKEGNDIIGILSYSTENPWNKVLFDIDYSRDEETTLYMLKEIEKEDIVKLYKFKFYYEDGTIEKSRGRATKPEALYNDFDGLMDWLEFDKLNDENMDSTKKVLDLASKIYKKNKKGLSRIEIVEEATDRVIDSIDVKN